MGDALIKSGNDIAHTFGLLPESCLITESHYFRGRFRLKDAKEKHLLESDRVFEDSLIRNDVILHYKHISELDNGARKEKGIDVWYVLETYELSVYRDFDFIVLITGDADHEMLARKIKALKKHVVLVTWNFAKSDSTSPALEEEVTVHLDLEGRFKKYYDKNSDDYDEKVLDSIIGVVCEYLIKCQI